MFRFVSLFRNVRDAEFQTYEQVKAHVTSGKFIATGMIMSPNDRPVAMVVTSRLTMIN